MKISSLLALLLLHMGIPSLPASNMLIKNQQLRDGETLVSSDERFALAFFSPPNSKNRYVGIWYNKVSIQNVVWVANRDRPVTDSSGSLTINDQGNLVIIDKKGGLTMIAYGSPSSNTSAELLENGNLVLRNENGGILWQSFDYPTDTFLPGMKLGRNLKTRKNLLLTSWASASDPAPGDYSLGIDPNGTNQFIIWKRGIANWTSGLLTDKTFSLIPSSEYRNLYKYSFIRNELEQYFTYTLYNKSSIVRDQVLYSGEVQETIWSEDLQAWKLCWTLPGDSCDQYTPCGPYATCSTNTLLLCECLEGFVPISPGDWESSSWSDGCKRQTEIKCGKEDAFLSLKTMKYPANMEYVEGIGLTSEKCKSMCINNCSCTSYAPANNTACLLWSGDLVGLPRIHDGRDIFIRISSSDLDGGNSAYQEKEQKRIHVLIVVIVIPVSLFLCFSVYCLRRITHKRKGNARRRLFELELGINISSGTRFITGDKDEKGSHLTLFDFSTILMSTDNFSSANKLGEGGFGAVYKGNLPEGQEIAVKRLSRSSGQGLEEFKNELKVIAKLQHMNLVRLFGCAIQAEEMLLVYEYMPNGSLDSSIFDPTKRMKLDWEKRVNIILGISQGLLYLHIYSRLKVIHRDLKASNILLDSEMTPKISDFGIARMFANKRESEANTRRIVGTYGYMSPEYAMKGIFSVKSDVFSFGVLLLEIISGKKNSSYKNVDFFLNFLGYVWELWIDGKVAEFVDPLLGDNFPKHELMRYVNIALLCVQDHASDRPTMLEVVSMLSNETKILPYPKQPAFYIQRNITEGVSVKDRNKIYSSNGLTISLVEAR